MTPSHSTTIITLSWIGLTAGALTAIAIIIDIASGRRQHMRIMEVTWPVTGLYLGPLGWWAYRRMGRPIRKDHNERKPDKPFWQSVFVSVTHCGGGCTLGDIISDSAIFLFGVSVTGIALINSYILDFIAAYLLGILFQYLPIRAMGETHRITALWKAIKADTLSLISFEIGLFGWMALVQLVWFPQHLEANDPVFWFMMQIGMAIGFLTAYPTNWWLVRRGIKHAM